MQKISAWSSAINMDLTKLGIQISKIESYFNQFLKKVKDDDWRGYLWSLHLHLHYFRLKNQLCFWKPNQHFECLIVCVFSAMAPKGRVFYQTTNNHISCIQTGTWIRDFLLLCYILLSQKLGFLMPAKM